MAEIHEYTDDEMRDYDREPDSDESDRMRHYDVAHSIEIEPDFWTVVWTGKESGNVIPAGILFDSEAKAVAFANKPQHEGSSLASPGRVVALAVIPF